MRFIQLLLKKLDNVSIKDKLLISYILVVFLPVLLVGLILTNGLRQMSLGQAIREATVNVERIKKRAQDILKVPTDISKKIYLDQQLRDMIKKEYRTTWEVVKSYHDYHEFDQYKALYEEIEGIRLYSFNKTMLDNWQFMKITDEILESAWYKDALREKGKISWNYIYDETKNDEFLSLTRMLNDIDGNVLGVLVIGVNKKNLHSIFSGEPFDTIISDEKGRIVAAKETRLVGSNIGDLGMNNALINNERGIYQINYKEKVSKAIVDTFSPGESANKFKIISIFPIGNIVREANNISFLGFGIIAISLLFALILIYIFSYIFCKRINCLSEEMHKVAQGNFDVVSSIEGDDEIGQLSRVLNTMAKSIKELVHEMYEIDLQKKQLIIKQKEAKLKILANQINPHFLFNALETIRMKAHCKGETEISEITKMLGKILRKNLEISNELVALSTEIDLVESYLEIQRFRFGDKISYHIDVDEDIKDYKILPLLIQPVVENAVIHGLENKEENGKIDIRAKKSGGYLKISVIDDGLGMSDANLRQVVSSLNNWEEDTGKNVGLKNVHQRIRLFYGEQYGLEISSCLHKGSQVDILLPEKDGTDAKSVNY